MKLNRFIMTAFLAAMLAGAPRVAQAFEATATAGIEEAVTETKITVNNNSDNQEVRVQDAEGQRLEVYNVLGVRISSYRIDSNDKTFTLSLQRGCYILKVGKVVRKTFIR
jgi:maltose-binding protein MalE